MGFTGKITVGSEKALSQMKQVTGELQSINNLFNDGGGLNVKISSVNDTLSIAQGQAAVLEAAFTTLNAGGMSLTELVTDLEGNVGGISTKMKSVLSEFLKIDPRGVQQELQEMLRDIRSGEKDWSAFIDRISEGGNRIGEQIREMVEGFREGRYTIEQLQQTLDSLRETAAKPDSALANALHQIEQDARGGRL